MHGIYYREFRHLVWFNPSAVFNGFLHSSYEKTNTSLYLGMSLSLHTGTHVRRTVSRAAHGMSFFLSGRCLTEGPLGCGSAECWRCISPGATNAYVLGLTDAGQTLPCLPQCIGL